MIVRGAHVGHLGSHAKTPLN